MSEMMLSIFSGHVLFIIPTANQQLCLVCALLPCQNTNLIFSDIIWSKCGQITAKLQTSESVHIEDQGGYLFRVHEEKQTTFLTKQKPRLYQDS